MLSVNRRPWSFFSAEWVFALTIFWSAFLLFLVQPIIARYILPWFGGSADVWTTCVLFFQLMLLAGYLYAYLLTRYLNKRLMVIAHVVLIAAALFFLPITPADYWKPQTVSDPVIRIMILLTSCVGLPYFVLSATGPLLQRWYSLLRPDRSPYRFYALSNVGSLLALLAYPFLLEPLMPRTAQASLWSWGTGLFGLLCCLSSLIVWRQPPEGMQPAPATKTKREELQPNNKARVLWLLLPATASGMLLAITNKMCQELAVIPFLWIVPLVIYLLTFILAFDRAKWYSRKIFGLAMIAAYGTLCYVLFHKKDFPLTTLLGLLGAVLFVSCMVCHGELARLRPPTRFLTSYYLFIAAGGAIGGICVAVIAPLVFSDYLEFQISLVLCALLMLVVFFTDQKSRLYRGNPRWASILLFAALAGFGYILQQEREGVHAEDVATRRNFYGAVLVAEHLRDNPQLHFFEMGHGKTLHGIQFANASLNQIPTTYYSSKSGAGMCFRYYPVQENRKIGILGLGAGTLAAWGKESDTIRFYEINPAVVDLARTYFSYLSGCRAKVDVILGDGRLSLESEGPQDFDILVLDAFNNDTPPLHLLTKEAFETYRRHLKPDGAIVVNISNNFLNLQPVVSRLAEHMHFKWRLIIDPNAERQIIRMPSQWVLMTNNDGLLQQEVISRSSARPKPGTERFPLWTDDFTSLFQLMSR